MNGIGTCLINKLHYFRFRTNYIKTKNKICTTSFFSFAVMGKAEGQNENWHGHVTALSVSNEYRRLGLAATLMHNLEEISEK